MNSNTTTYVVYFIVFLTTFGIDIWLMPGPLDHALEGMFIGHLIARVANK